MSQALNTADLAQRVTEIYHEVAVRPETEFHFETGRALAERLGYPVRELDAIPAGAIDSYAGVGYFLDLAAIQPGETVLDLGSGSGMDSFLAANQAGPAGRIVGVDLTDAQLDKARRLGVGFGTVEFRRTDIGQTQLADSSVDVVISNGVINLAPDKDAVFHEVARVLRPGGRFALADIVTGSPLPDAVSCDASLWAACIGGAMQIDRYQEAIARAGLRIETVRKNDQYRFLSDSAVSATEEWGVMSVSLLAHLPG
jgi:ubiquinone/menaquinone biosynthesis C-methylase UbiE